MTENPAENENIYDDAECISRGDMADFNFWEINNYKKTVKRMDDGARLCEDFMKMVSERAEIESSYYSKMKAWSTKWDEGHKKGAEYGALKTAMHGIMLEGEQLADIHYELKEKLMNDVYQSVNQWKKNNYHKSLMNYKEVKSADEGFNKAQKPWVRRVEEVNKYKKGYYSSCRSHDTARKQEEDGKARSSSDEQLKKLRDKVEKGSQELNTMKEKYQDALRDLTGYIPKYQEDMKYQFDKCQDFEETRKEFFESVLMEYHKAIDREEYVTRMSVIYQTLSETLKKTDTRHDLDFFAEVYGVNSKLITPEYEEYDRNATGSSGATNTGYQNSNNNDGENLKPSRSGVCTTL